MKETDWTKLDSSHSGLPSNLW